MEFAGIIYGPAQWCLSQYDMFRFIDNIICARICYELLTNMLELLRLQITRGETIKQFHGNIVFASLQDNKR